MNVKPLLKWAGGKTQVLSELINKLKKNISFSCLLIYFLCSYQQFIYCITVNNKNNPTPQTDTEPTTVDFKDTGELQIFLPFKEKETDIEAKDIFASISSYLILVQLGYNKKLNGDKIGVVVVNKKSIDNPIVDPNHALKVIVKKNKAKELAIIDIQGVSIKDKELTILGYSKELHTPENALPGQEIFKLSRTVECGTDVIVNIDVATQEIKKIKKTNSEDKFRRQLEEQSNQKKEKKKVEEQSKEEIFKNVSDYKNNLEFVKTVGNYLDKESATDIFLKDKYLYFTTGASQTLEIFNVSDFNIIKPVNSFYIEKYAQNPNANKDIRDFYSYFYKVKVADKYAYVIDSGYGVNKDLLILDISSATSPKFLSFYDTKSEPQYISVEDKYIYLITQKDFQIIDVSNPKDLKQINFYKFDIEKDTYVFAMTVNKNYVYIGGFKTGLIILDVSNTKQISLVSHTKSEDGIIPLGIDNDYHLFVSKIDLKGESVSNIEIYNIKNPISPSLIKTIPLGKTEGAISLTVQQNKLYAGLIPLPPEKAFQAEINSLKVFDISDISNPELIDGYASEKKCFISSIDKQEKYLYLSSYNYCPVIILKDSKKAKGSRKGKEVKR